MFELISKSQFMQEIFRSNISRFDGLRSRESKLVD